MSNSPVLVIFILCCLFYNRYKGLNAFFPLEFASLSPQMCVHSAPCCLNSASGSLSVNAVCETRNNENMSESVCR